MTNATVRLVDATATDFDDGLSSLGTYGNALYGSGATQGSSSGHNGLVLKYRQ